MCGEKHKFRLHNLNFIRKLQTRYELSNSLNYLNAVFARHLKIKKHKTYWHNPIVAPTIMAFYSSQVNLYRAVDCLLPIVTEFAKLNLV